MIDPILFSFELFGFQFNIYWYGVLVGVGVVLSAWIANKYIVKYGGPEEYLYDLLLWVVPAGIIGARLWYVLNDMAGGSQYFIEDPTRIYRINEGGLHIYGSIFVGMVVAYWYTRRKPMDFWLILDALAPTVLIGQAIGRIANFINQELYGPPTDLPWGVPISADNRIGEWRDLTLYPEETTRFHPTFFYEIIWNMLAAGLIYWLNKRFEDKIKPSTNFYLFLFLAGFGRFFIEYLRPDQPLIGNTSISYSRVAATLMAIVGAVGLLVRYQALKLPFIKVPADKYDPKQRRSGKGKR